MAENNCVNQNQEHKETSKMPYMCPMMYYGTYPVPMQDMQWPPNPGMMCPGMGGYGNQYGMYRMPPQGMYGGMGGYYNVPFPESAD